MILFFCVVMEQTGISGLDYIYVLHEGRIVHEGTHQQLVEEKASLYLQLLGRDPNEVTSHTSHSQPLQECSDHDAKTKNTSRQSLTTMYSKDTKEISSY
jgi:ABC-type glutathione transport system ATPase component